ncbi:MAG: sugar ABC transporter ATP-binding protein [Planctomycetota bacterium]|jgi:ribose transport system ATP-binding protein
MSPSPDDVILRIRGLEKTYGPVRALAGVDFDLARGEVHALVGENGAGKSTLARCIAGVTSPDAGTMEVPGGAWAPTGTLEAQRRGVRMVMQELNLIPTLTIAENIYLPDMPNRAGWIDYARMNADASSLLSRLGLCGLDSTTPVGALGVGQQQMVEIAAGLSRRCDVLILDEPTAALADAEIAHLFANIARLKEHGTALIYISHRMEEIKRVADRITVLRDGAVVAPALPPHTPLDEIIAAMVGRDLSQAHEARTASRGEVMLRVRDLRRGDVVRGVSFEAHAGEVLGFAGLMGSGRTETMRAIFGADPADGGDVFLRDAASPAVIRSPADAVRHGMALLTEDRKSEGLLLPLPVRANITLARLREFASGPGVIRAADEAEAAARLVERLRIRCATVEQPVRELSGGNQQKVVIAKWLLADCGVLIFDEPTRGIDVGAKFEIYALLGELASAGKAIVVVSSDLEELLAISDRIAVVSAGRIAATFERAAFDRDRIMAAALSGYVSGTDGARRASA